MHLPMKRRPVLSVVAALALATPAAAQVPPDTGRVVPLAPVVVTVLRTPLELVEAPFAVAVAGPDRVQRGRRALGLEEPLRGIPGVQVDNRYNYALGERISIRGFGARSQFGVRGVRVLVDGIPATLPDGQTALSHVDVGLLRRAEVVRGPAAAIYGNTAGGVIQLETALPRDAPLAQEISLITGSHGLLRLSSTTSGRTSGGSYLLNVSRLAYQGHREFNEAENLHLNARLGWDRGATSVRVLGSAVDYEAQNPGSLSRELLREDRRQAFTRNVTQRTGESGRQAQIGGTLRQSTRAGEWELTTHGLVREIDNPIPPAIIHLVRRSGGARALFRASGARVGWTIGAELERQRDDRRNFANLSGERGDLTLDQDERVTNLALFTQLSATPLPRADLLAGLRADWFRFAAEDRLVGSDDPDDSGTRSMHALSPSLGLSVAATEGLRIYGNVGTSFETPTTTELVNRPEGAGGFNPDLRPQEALSAELGAKGLAVGRVFYEIAGYRARVRNSLVPFQVPESEGRDFFRNAGSAIHQGLEVSATASILSGSVLQLAYTYTDARFREYTVADRVFAGNRVPGVAPHRLDLALTQTTRGGFFLTGELRHLSEMAVDDANTATSSAYTLVDLRAGVERVRFGRLSAEPFVGISNLFDVEYNTSVVVNAFGGRYFEPGPGRQLHLGIRAAVQ